MRQHYIWVCLMSIILPLSFAFSQPGTSHNVLLKSAVERFPPNADHFIRNPSVSPQEIAGGYYLRFVQFEEIPTQPQKEEFLATGVKILGYIPHKVYLVAFPAGYQVSNLSDFEIRSVMPVSPAHKMDPAVYQQEIPDYAQVGDKALLVVQYYPYIDRNRVLRALSSAGAEVSELSSQYYPQLDIIASVDDIFAIASLPEISYVELTPPPSIPDDIRGRSLHRSNVLNTEYPTGRHYDGSGVNVLCRDDGDVGPHIDFQGRIDNLQDNNSQGTHGDGVAGIMAGAGNLNPYMRGMASGAFMYVTDYQANFLDTTLGLHINHDVMITNSSYSNGCNAGYTTITQTVDQQAFDYPSLLHVFSAGNSGTSDCGYGAGSIWGNITGGHKQGKNVIATANLRSDGILENSSSRGPAHDGRIKPDIAANGFGHQSTSPDNGYITFGGTSGAAPGIAGISAQLYQAYKELNGGVNPEGSLIKAVLLNTAYDRGNKGPDFRFGWGRVNARRAIEVIEKNTFVNSTISQGMVNLHSISVPPGTKEVRIMTYWLDPPASVQTTKALINDLDMVVTDPNSQTYNPWTLDPDPLSVIGDLPAFPGVDTLNNVEQVVITDPVAGTYNIDLTGTAVPMGPQSYYVVYTFVPDEIVVTYPLGGEGIAPGDVVRTRWDAIGTDPADGTFALEYTLDDGMSWNSISNNVPADQRYFDWAIPTNITGKARLRVSRGVLSDESEVDFSIIGVPDIQLDQSCPSSLTISWDAIPSANGYDIFTLGPKYMDSLTSIGSSPTPAYTMNVQITEEVWIAVRARGDSGEVGRRSIAILREAGIRFQCPINNDVGMVLDGTTSGPYQDCRNNTIPVVTTITNEGTDSLTNIPVFYQLNNDLPVSGTHTGIIPSGDSVSYTFPTFLNLSGTGQNNLKIWTAFPDDSVHYNDTVIQNIEVLPSMTEMLPFGQDFENFANCATTTNCETEVCSLIEGWINVQNGIGDDIDWRVNSGNTPSAGTGPVSDHKPGATVGKYLYTESSGGCNGAEAVLLSPCIDLSGITAGQFSFWYHMFGTNMGELHIDIRLDTFWINDVIQPITGDQGNSWQNAIVDLTPYSGQLVTIRIRGITGATGFQSDIALDDFAIYDLNGPPLADFTASANLACPFRTIQLLDQSTNATAWDWQITPNAISYVALTNQNSQNPLVQFQADGIYEVKLTASNANGGTEEIKTQYITISSGEALDIIEDFEGPVFPPQQWTIGNADGGLTWDTSTVVGIDGNATLVTGVANYINNNQGTEDDLTTFFIDLSSADEPKLVFDRAYAEFDPNFVDELRITAALNCDENFFINLYSASGATLATAPMDEDPFFPDEASDWERDTVDLSNYVGTVMTLRFTNISGFGNNLFLDNIQVIDIGTPGPNAAFESSGLIVCEGSPVTFTDMTSGGSNVAYSWNFGQDASPASAGTSGPHNVVYQSPGTKIITLTVGDSSGSNQTSLAIQVEPLPDPDFTFTTVGSVYKFTNTTVGGTSYFWDFGDGDTSFMENPQHFYTVNNTYQVILVVWNECGPDTTIQTIDVTTVGLEDEFSETQIKVFPNPGSGSFSLMLTGNSTDAFFGEITDLRGRKVEEFSFRKSGYEHIHKFNLESQPKGVYLLRIIAGDQHRMIKLLIE